MKPKTLYLAFCLAGVLLPYAEFVPWVFQHGLNLVRFAHELFANRIGAFFGMEVIVCGRPAGFHANREQASWNSQPVAGGRRCAQRRSFARPAAISLPA